MQAACKCTVLLRKPDTEDMVLIPDRDKHTLQRNHKRSDLELLATTVQERVVDLYGLDNAGNVNIMSMSWIAVSSWIKG